MYFYRYKRMKMKKYIIVSIIGLLFFNLQISAQNQNGNTGKNLQDRSDENRKFRRQNINNSIENADYIFEGTVLKNDIYFRNRAINSQIINITKVFKGKLKLGTIEVLSYSSLIYIEDNINTRYSQTHFEHEAACLFICRIANELPFDSKYNIDKVDNSQILYCNDINVVSYNYFAGDGKGRVIDAGEGKARGLDTIFKNKTAVYKYLSTFKSIKIPRTLLQEEEKIVEEKRTSEPKFSPIMGPEIPASQSYVDSIQNAMWKPSRDSLLRMDSMIKLKFRERELRIQRSKRISDSLQRLNFNFKNKSRLKSGTEDYLSLIYNNQTYGPGGTIDCKWNGQEEIKIQFIIDDPLAVCEAGGASSIDYFSTMSPHISSAALILEYVRTDINSGLYEFVFNVSDVKMLGTDEIYLDFDYTFYTKNDPSSRVDDQPCDVPHTNNINTSFFINVSIENPVTKLSLDKSNITIDPNKNIFAQLNATVNSNASIKTITWSSDDNSIATVDQTGLVAAMGFDNSTTITATADDISNGIWSKSCTVTILPENITSVELTPPTDLTNSKYLLHKNYTCGLTILPLKASIKSITWSASHEITINPTTGVFFLNAYPQTEVLITVIVKDKNNRSFTRILSIGANDVLPNLLSYTVSNNGEAGIDNILTIKGYGFLFTPTVEFTSADDNKGLYLTHDDCDVISYTSDANNYCEFKMYLPSMVSMYDAATSQLTFYTIGTGDIDILTYNNLHSNRKQLTINRCYLQTPIVDKLKNRVTKKYRTVIKDYSANPIPPSTTPPKTNGVAFKLDQSIVNPDMIKLITRALSDWSCTLSMNIVIDPNSQNIITLNGSSYPMDASSIMETSTPLYGGSSTNTYFYRKSYSIVINSAFVNKFDYSMPGILYPTYSSVTDFYATFLHEVGHVLGLNHINNRFDLMNWVDNIKNFEGREGLNACTNSINAALFMKTYSLANNTLTAPQVPYCFPPNPLLSLTAAAKSPWEIDLQYTINPSKADSYDPPQIVIEKSIDNINFNAVETIDGRFTTYANRNLTQKTKYYYRVKVKNSMGESAWKYTNATTLPEVVPPTPSSSSSSYNYGNPTIYWQANTEQTLGYRIFRSNSYNGTYTQIASVSATTTSYTDFSADASNTNYYIVIAYNNTFESAPSTPTVVFSTPCNSPIFLNLSYFSGSKPNQYATQTANVYYYLQNGQNAIVEAGSLVHIQQGFSAKPGSFFHASISPCSGNDNSILKSNVDTTSTTNLKGNEITLTSKINIFPNPTTGLISIELKGDVFTVELYNTLGILVKSNTNCVNQTQIDISNLASSTYYLKVKTQNNQQEAITIVKQ
jgi:hypothetical protein